MVGAPTSWLPSGSKALAVANLRAIPLPFVSSDGREAPPLRQLSVSTAAGPLMASTRRGRSLKYMYELPTKATWTCMEAADGHRRRSYQVPVVWAEPTVAGLAPGSAAVPPRTQHRAAKAAGSLIWTPSSSLAVGPT